MLSEARGEGARDLLHALRALIVLVVPFLLADTVTNRKLEIPSNSGRADCAEDDGEDLAEKIWLPKICCSRKEREAQARGDEMHVGCNLVIGHLK